MFRTLILFLQYDEQKSERVFPVLRQIIKRCNQISFTLVHIDNLHSHTAWELVRTEPFEEYTVGGDNRCHEFSGWDKGWNLAREKIDEPFHVVITANDALLNSKPTHELDCISNQLLDYVAQNEAVVGWVDTFSRVSPDPIDMLFRPMSVFGHSVRLWVSTCFIVFSSCVFEAVAPLTSFLDTDRVYHRHFEEGVFRPHCGLSPGYQEFLLRHQSAVWSNRQYVLSAETFRRFQSKTRSIINESLLGHRISRTGARMLDLATLCSYSTRRRAAPFARVCECLEHQLGLQYRMVALLSLARSAKEICASSKDYYFARIRSLIYSGTCC
jgi:hypothetical protein